MRFALGIEYDGGGYVGWQRQRSGTGVQAVVESALSTVADEPVEAVCAGRTDAGVHALAQVVHFDSGATRPLRGWLLGINSNLPEDVSAAWIVPVDDDFHARFSATSRTYRYLVLNRLVRSAIDRDRAWWVHEDLDDAAMQAGAGFLLGKHDFSAFRAAGCQASTPVREITSISIRRERDWIAITVTANAFLQHMVRNLTGTLVAIGRGDEHPEWAAALLEGRDRRRAGMAAPAHGLALVDVEYPESCGIPSGKRGHPSLLCL